MSSLKAQTLNIGGIPAVIYGGESGQVYIFVHGMNGSKEEAEKFSRHGVQVLAFDVPAFDPVNTLPALESVYDFAASHWESISLYAVSLGAWFSMVCLQDKPIMKALLVSPVVSMKNLIERMMQSSGIKPYMLKERGTIANLSWDYYSFAVRKDITRWDHETAILYPENDNITPYAEVKEFAERFSCALSVLPDSEHWIHTESQLESLYEWEKVNMQ